MARREAVKPQIEAKKAVPPATAGALLPEVQAAETQQTSIALRQRGTRVVVAQPLAKALREPPVAPSTAAVDEMAALGGPKQKAMELWAREQKAMEQRTTEVWEATEVSQQQPPVAASQEYCRWFAGRYADPRIRHKRRKKYVHYALRNRRHTGFDHTSCRWKRRQLLGDGYIASSGSSLSRSSKIDRQNRPSV